MRLRYAAFCLSFLLYCCFSGQQGLISKKIRKSKVLQYEEEASYTTSLYSDPVSLGSSASACTRLRLEHFLLTRGSTFAPIKSNPCSFSPSAGYYLPHLHASCNDRRMTLGSIQSGRVIGQVSVPTKPVSRKQGMCQQLILLNTNPL